MGPFVTVAFLVAAGCSFLDPGLAWTYCAGLLAFDAWLLWRMRSLDKGPVTAGAPPYYFSDDEAGLVGRYRLYFAYPALARQAAAVLAAVGLTSLILLPWLTIKQHVVEALLIGVNLFAVARFTKALAPLMALRHAASRGDRAALRLLELHEPTWAKIRAGNSGSGS
jgi:hypothetical protein